VSQAEDNFLAWMQREKLTAQRKHCEDIIESGGTCWTADCHGCPLNCAIVETDEQVVAMAREWLAANP
jgi:hypothetical protein